MADLLKSFQNAAQVEVQDPPLLKVFQVIGQAEYYEFFYLRTYQVIGQVEYYEFCYLRTYQVIGQVEYDPVPPPKRQFPVPNPHTIWQSQGYKRVFPVLV